jgi:glucose-1-phosphate adenylyltransferase
MPLQSVVAVVLGGGRGTRLYPLTKFRAKPAVPIGGKYRLIDISMSNCIHSGITRIFVITQFLSASLNRHVHRTYNFDVFSGGFVELLATEQTLQHSDWYQGTADAVRRQMERILSREPADVLIPAGDHLYRMDYGELVRFHRENQADLTVAVVPVSAEDASRHTVLKADPKGRVDASRAASQDREGLAEFKSCPGEWRPYLASMGVYLFRTDVLASLLAENGGESLSLHILPAAVRSARVFAYVFDGYWEDVGTLSAFYEANLALTRPDPPFDFYEPQRPIYSRSRFLPSSRIDECRLERVVLADGCRLYEADLQECVIGLRSIVRPGARLRQVVLMGADFYETGDEKAANRRLGRPDVGIGTQTSIDRAVIDKNARIGKRVKIRSHEGQADRDEELYSIRDGIVVIPDNTLIPDGTII